LQPFLAATFDFPTFFHPGFLRPHHFFTAWRFLSRSHLHQEITNSEVFPKDYHVYRKDRNNYGGGVFILIDKNIPSSQVVIDSSCEVMWAQLHLQNHPNIILGSFYCLLHSPVSIWGRTFQMYPTNSANVSWYSTHDFNSPGIDWSSGCLTESYLTATFRESLLLLSQDFLLEQIVTEPTRKENILDLCFIPHPSYVYQSRTVPGLSDHNAVIVNLIDCTPCNSKLRKKMYCFKRADSYQSK